MKQFELTLFQPNDMKKQTGQYAPDSQTTSGERIDNRGAVDNAVSASQDISDVDTDSHKPDDYDENGPTHDSDEDESGVDRRGKNADALTGTDNDETGSGETMATES